MAFSDEIIRSKFLAYLTAFYSSRRDLQIAGMQKIDLGWETEKFSLDICYEDASGQNQEELFIRVFVDQNAVENATREYRVMQRLNELNFPVPEVFCLEVSNSPLGTPFIIMQMIPGRSMMAFLRKASDEESLKLLRQFCKIWVDLHRQDWRQFALNPSEIILGDPFWHINHCISEWEGSLNRHREAQILLPILEWLKTGSSAVSCKQLSLIHGDYHPDNLLMREDGAYFVIDWGAADIADFRVDLGWTLLLATTYGYPIREILLSEYERLSGIKIEQIEYFEVLAILRRLRDLVVSLAPAKGASTLGMRPEAVQMMKQDAFHYRNVYSLLKERTGLILPKIEAILASL